MSPNKNVLKINNKDNTAKLVLKSSPEGFSLGVEGDSTDTPPPSRFCIESDSDVYLPFLKFFKRIEEIQNACVLIDDMINIEHAPVLICNYKQNKLLLNFAIENGFLPKVRHKIDKDIKITNCYVELFNSLIHIKQNNNQNNNYVEMSRS